MNSKIKNSFVFFSGIFFSLILFVVPVSNAHAQVTSTTGNASLCSGVSTPVFWGSSGYSSDGPLGDGSNVSGQTCRNRLEQNAIGQSNPNYQTILNACYNYTTALGDYDRSQNYTAGSGATGVDNCNTINTMISHLNQDSSDLDQMMQNPSNQNDINADSGQISQDYASVMSEAGVPGQTTAQQQATSNAQAAGALGTSEQDCVLAHPLTGDGTFAGCINQVTAYAAYTALWLSSLLLGIVGYFFDTVMNYTVVGMATYLPNTVINTGWADVRDIGNLVFIFMAIYVGIKTIIGMDTGKTKKFITNLIVAALLVNFSLFFTKILIDASNVLSIVFYNLIINGNQSFSAFTSKFAGPLGVTTLFSNPFSANVQGAIGALSNLGFAQIVVVGAGGSIFLLVTAVTFATAGILFVIRFVVFIFLLILSPIFFLFSMMPGLSDYAKKWWETLVGQLIFAPLYMLLILIVVVLINSPTSKFKVTALSSALISPAAANATAATLTSSSNTITSINSSNIGSCITNSDGSTSNCDTVSQILFFIIIIFLMNGATYIAVQQASRGQSLVGKAVGWAQNTTTGFASRMALGGAGKLGRETIGRTASALTSDTNKFGRFIKDTGASKSVIASTLARGVYRGSEYASKSSFDARKISSLQTLAKKANINIGKASGEGGYQAQLTREAENDLKALKDFGGPTAATSRELYKNRSALAEAQVAYADALAGGDSTKKADALTKLRSAEDAVKKSERTSKEETRARQAGYLASRTGFKGSAISFFSGTHAASNKKAIELFVKGNKAENKEDEIKAKGGEYSDTLDAITKASTYSGNRDTDIQKILDKIEDPKVFKNMRASVLTDPAIIKNYSPSTLKVLARSRNLSREDRKKIVDGILGNQNHEAYNFIRNNKEEWYTGDPLQGGQRGGSQGQTQVNRGSDPETYDVVGNPERVRVQANQVPPNSPPPDFVNH